MADQQLTVTDSQPLPAAGGLSIARSEPLPEDTPGALDQIGTSIKNQASGLYNVLMSPFSESSRKTIAQGIIQAHKEQYQKAKDAYDKGDYAGMVEHTLGTIVPLVGPLIENTAEKATEGGRPYEAATDLLLGPLISKGLEFAPGAVSGAAGAVSRAAESPLTRELVGVVSPRVKNVLTLADKLRKAKEAAVAATAETPVDSTLDDVAQGMAGKKFAQLDPAGQQAVRDIAARMQGSSAPVSTASPVNTSAVPVQPPPFDDAAINHLAVQRLQNYGRQIIDEQAARRLGVGRNLMPTPPMAQPIEGVPGALDAMPQAAAPSARPLWPPAARRTIPAKPDQPVMPDSSGAQPAEPTAAQDFASAARTKKAQALARVLDQGGVAHDEFSQLPLKDQQKWLGDMAVALKINKTGQMSPAAVGETLFELRKLQNAGQPAAQ